jgi:hypothetical protein
MARGRMLILLLLAGCIALRVHLPRESSWITDSGNKRITVESIALSGYTSVAIGYPAAGIDPEFRFFPRGGEHFIPVGSRMFALSPFQFPALTTPLYVAFRSAGLYIIPILAFAAILLLLRRMAADLGAREDVVIVAAAIGSPLFFYALLLWEHTLAVSLSTAAIALLLRQRDADGFRRVFAAGLLLAASTVFREEGYVVLFAVAIAMIPRGRALGTLAAGFALVIVPHWIVQQAVYGEWLGLHAAAHAGGDPVLPHVGKNIWYFLFQFHATPVVAAILAIPAIALLLIGATSGGSRGGRAVVLLFGAAAVAAGVALILVHDDPIANTAATQGLLLAFPAVLVFAAAWLPLARRSDATGLLARIAVAYVVMMPLALRANWTGIIWGPRYFLPIVPVVALLLPAAARELGASLDGAPRWLLRAALVVLGIASVALQLWGVVLLDRKLHASDDLRRLVVSLDERVIVTDVFWLPEELAAIFYEKQIMTPVSPQEVAPLIDALRRAGVERFVYVTAPEFGFRTGEVRARMAQLSTSRIAFVERDVPLLNVTIDRCRVPGALP